MKKTLLTLLAVLLMAAMAFTLVGCGNTPPEDPEDPKDPVVVNTVTETEWKAYFAAIETVDKVAVEVAYTSDVTVPYMPESFVCKLDGDKSYTMYAYADAAENEESYVVWNDAETSAIFYEYDPAETAWYKETSTAPTAEIYEMTKAYQNPFANLGLTDESFRTSADGEDAAIGDLFSAFTYNETSKTYSGTLYVRTGENTYSPTEWTLTFADGKLTNIVNSSTMSMGETSAIITTNVTVAYNVSITIPQAVLDAEEYPDEG